MNLPNLPNEDPLIEASIAAAAVPHAFTMLHVLSENKNINGSLLEVSRKSFQSGLEKSAKLGFGYTSAVAVGAIVFIDRSLRSHRSRDILNQSSERIF